MLAHETSLAESTVRLLGDVESFQIVKNLLLYLWVYLKTFC